MIEKFFKSIMGGKRNSSSYYRKYSKKHNYYGHRYYKQGHKSGFFRSGSYNKSRSFFSS